MKLDELLNQLEKLNLPKDSYVIVSSGSLAAHNIREANDLDILPNWDLWNSLSEKFPVTLAEGHVENINFGDIQVLGHGSHYRREDIATYDEIFKTAEIIDEYKFMNLKLLRKFKEKQGREKDLKDVELIDQFLSQNLS